MTQAEAVDAIATLLESAAAVPRGSLKEHGPRRLAVLLGEEPIVFKDIMSADRPSDGEFQGQVVLFTPARVIVTDFSTQEDPKSKSRVTAKTWARSTLVQLELQGPDEKWELAEEGRLALESSIVLHYANGQSLRLPRDAELKSSVQAAFEFLPRLYEDLVK
jgi:hypothetical protein